MEVEKIYFDMDGVLADFNRGIKDLCNMEPRPQDPALGEEYDADMWNKVKMVDHYYDRLSLMPGAKDLFDMVHAKYGDKCEILSAIPRPSRGIVGAGDDKIKWVRRLLNKDVKVNIVLRKEKKYYCFGNGCILIDDLEPNIKEWNQYGGKGILHRCPNKTVMELKRLNVL